MIRNTMETNTYENLHGGTGFIEIHKKITKKDGVEGLNLFAEVIVKPYSSIGYHLHADDAEAYYIIEGEGIFIDHNNERKIVTSGDLCFITKGQSHGIENNHDHELKLIAIVY